MINTCDPEVATWSDDGLTFVVKDTKKFQYDNIPKYFKHNNFSSFVRQLNFYGFRKVRSDPVLLKDAESSEESKYWKFHHEKFQRGRPDLLSEIRKSNQTETADKQEVEALKQELTSLKRKLAEMCTDMEGLKALVGSLIQNQQTTEFCAYEVPAKKRRFNEALTTVPSNPAAQDVSPYPILSNGNKTMFDVTADPPLSGMDVLKDIKPPKNTGRNESVGATSFTSQDEALLTSLFSLDPLDEIEVLESATGTNPAAPTPTPPMMSLNDENI
jgi:hypothetical protein